MTLKKVHDKQPEKFEFTKENLELAKNILEKYPKNQKKSRSYASTISCAKPK